MNKRAPPLPYRLFTPELRWQPRGKCVLYDRGAYVRMQVMPTAMLFVPSIEGISHNFDEVSQTFPPAL